MGTIVQFIQKEAAFEPQDIRAMSMALDEVCKTLDIVGKTTAQEVIAMRIIELARRGERDPIRLRNRLLEEANGNASV